jgi:biopolymer transport protein TolR
MSIDLNHQNQFQDSIYKKSFISEINMTPFVDVCLVLLIIFMVTAPFAISGVHVQLPKTKQAKTLSLSQESLILSINKKGEYYLGKTLLKESALVSKIKDSMHNDNSSSIFIRADQGVPYGKVMIALTAAQQAGILRIGMLGEQKQREIK